MTYSIAARDPATGELGVAVQSHWFSVGSIVPWAEAGVGAVATQSFADPAYGPLGLDLMRGGRSAPDALRALVATDRLEARRQVAMVDAAGGASAHTGTLCIAEAGHVVGEGWSVQANMMQRDTVWQAMADAFAGADGDLADRLLDALDAAEREGGDVRGRQSAAMLVVSGTPSGRVWLDRLIDLRVEDADDPVSELRRLVELKRAYDRMNKGDELLGAGELERASEEYAAAQDRTGANVEPTFWRAVMLANAGRLEEARALIERVVRGHDGWAELLRRLPDAGLLPDGGPASILPET